MPRLEEIRANLVDRLQEAREQGWLGEAAAIETTLAALLRRGQGAREAKAAAKAQLTEVKARTEVATIADNLKAFLVLRGDAPSAHVLHTMSGCRIAGVLAAWPKRAYLGEAPRGSFPEPKPPAN